MKRQMSLMADSGVLQGKPECHYKLLRKILVRDVHAMCDANHLYGMIFVSAADCALSIPIEFTAEIAK